MVKAAQLLVFVFLLASGIAWADCQTVQAELTRVDGQVSVKPAGKIIRVTPKKLPYVLCLGDEVHTFTGRALVVSSAKDSIVVDVDSQLTIKERGSAGVTRGNILFSVQKRTESHSVQISTRLSVIGVKGTRFLVSDQGATLSVAMDEGVVDVVSTKGPLKLFREKNTSEQVEFSDFKKEGEQAVEAQKKEFEAYKENLQREFVGYVQNVVLSAGGVLDMESGQAVERKLDEKGKAAMAKLMAWGLR